MKWRVALELKFKLSPITQTMTLKSLLTLFLFIVALSIANADIVSIPEFGFQIESIGGKVIKSGQQFCPLTMYAAEISKITPCVSVEVHPMLKISMNECLERNIKDIQKLPNSSIVFSQEISPTECKIIYKGTVSNMNLIQIFRAVTHGDKLYLVLASCEDGDQWSKYGTIMNNSVDSFTFN
jgi:hypothetical protein